jgi:hypothetical protein
MAASFILGQDGNPKAAGSPVGITETQATLIAIKARANG